MPAENQTAAPNGTVQKGTTTASVSGETKDKIPQPDPTKNSPGTTSPPVRERGKDPQPTGDRSAATGPEGLDGMLRIVRSVGQALLLVGNVTKHEAPMDGVLRVVYMVVQEGERAIDAVLTGAAADKPPVISAPDSHLPDWPKAGAKDAPDTLDAVWGVLRPWLGELVERLPGSSDRQTAVKLWVTNCLLQWKELVGGVSDALKTSEDQKPQVAG